MDKSSRLFNQWCKDITSQRTHIILWKDPFMWINSLVPSSSNEMRICNDITNESINFGSQHSRFAQYLRQILDDFLATRQNMSPFSSADVKTSHHRGISWFWQQEQLRWINSPVYYYIISPMTLEYTITSQISHFILAGSNCFWIIPTMRHNLLLFSSMV